MKIIILKIHLFRKIIRGGGGKSLINFKNSENYTQDIDDFTFAEVKNVLDIPENSEYLSSLGLTLDAKAGDLPNGSKYTILAYRANRPYTFHKRQNFTVGEINPKMRLDEDSGYILLIISYGTNSVPNIYNINDINSVYVDTSSANIKEIFYQKQNFYTRGKINYEINIKLGRPSSVRITMDTGRLISDDEGKTISSISNAKITYQRPDKISLYNFNSISSKENTVNVGNFGEGYMLKTSQYINVLNAKNNTDIKFSANVRVNGLDYISEIRNLQLDGIKWGYRQTFHIKQLICGAYLGPNKTKFREFMCHNLGDGYSGIWTDKFVGNRYAWGRKAVVYKERDNPHESGNTWKESENPCPTGFRVPTLAEWEAVLDKNHNIREELKDKTGNFIGYKIGGRFSLFTHNDYRSWHWTTTIVPANVSVNGRNAYSIWITHEGTPPNDFAKAMSRYQDFKEYGQAVRCIRK